MTPKEKANELIERFSRHTEPSDRKHEAIQCAIIAVDEIIDSRPVITDSQVDYNDYWISVSAELNAL